MLVTLRKYDTKIKFNEKGRIRKESSSKIKI
jgi:hypothetical protein